jgi:hypothetical protein
VALEGIEVAQAQWPQDRWPEAQVGGVEDGRVVCLSGLEAVEQLSQCVDPQPLPQMGVERRDRLPEEDGVVREAWVGLNG